MGGRDAVGDQVHWPLAGGSSAVGEPMPTTRYLNKANSLQGKRFGTKFHDGCREQPRRHCGTRCKRYHRGTIRRIGRGEGQELTGSKITGDGRPSRTRRNPYGQITPESIRLLWGSKGSWGEGGGRRVGRRVGYTKKTGTRTRIGWVGQDQQHVHNNKLQSLRMQQSLTQVGTPPTNKWVTLHSTEARITLTHYILDTSLIDTKLPDRYFVLPLDQLPSNGPIYLISTCLAP